MSDIGFLTDASYQTGSRLWHSGDNKGRGIKAILKSAHAAIDHMV